MVIHSHFVIPPLTLSDHTRGIWMRMPLTTKQGIVRAKVQKRHEKILYLSNLIFPFYWLEKKPENIAKMTYLTNPINIIRVLKKVYQFMTLF